MTLCVDGGAVVRRDLPPQIEWFATDRPLLLGTYAWPGGYDAWYYTGLMDGFRFIARQERPQGSEARTPPQPAYDTPPPATMTGIAFHDRNGNGKRDEGEEGIASVAVTDGFSVARTDAQGRCTLAPSPKAVFVHVTRPSGYNVLGYCYQPLAPAVEFALAPSGKDETKFTFIHVTDTHLSTRPESLAGLEEFVREVNRLDPPPLFVLNSGDLIDMDKQLTAPAALGRTYFERYTATMDRLKMPHYNVAGDHTDVGYRMDRFPRGDIRCGKAMFWEYLGPNFASFEYGKLHFVTVDYVYHLGERPSHHLVPEHLSWLRQDLEQRTPGTMVLTASEGPLEEGVAGFAELAGRHDIRLQLVGDTHIYDEGDTVVASRAAGALSGTWWNGACADLSPQGYLIYQVDGQKLDCFYKGLRQSVGIAAPAFGAGVRGRVEVRAHLVQGGPPGALQFSLNGGEWKEMRETAPSFYRRSYTAQFDSTQVPDGTARLAVKSAGGDEVRETVLVVNNGESARPAGKDAVLRFEAQQPARGKVGVLLNEVEIAALSPRRAQEIPIPAGALRRVNHLAFRFAGPADGMVITEPSLTCGDAVLYDPRQEAIRKVRAHHWPKEIVEKAGALVGKGIPTSFAVRQNDFHFVVP